MTREEIIRNLEYTMEKHKNDTVSTFDTNISAMCKDILDYLKQEPCKDAISRQVALDAFGLSEKTRKYGGDHSGYDTVMLYEIQDVIEDLPSVTPKVEECEDAISRQAVLDMMQMRMGGKELYKAVYDLPSVTPKQKMGHWILQPSNKDQGERDFIWWKCSECGQVIFSDSERDRREFHAFCSCCGAKMIDVTDINVGNMAESED